MEFLARIGLSSLLLFAHAFGESPEKGDHPNITPALEQPSEPGMKPAMKAKMQWERTEKGLHFQLELQESEPEGSLSMRSLEGSDLMSWSLRDLESAGFEWDWNLRTYSGRKLKPGQYTMVLQVGDEVQIRPLVLD